MNNVISLLFCTGVMAMTMGCKKAPEPQQTSLQLPVSIIANSHHCAFAQSEPSVRWLTDNQALLAAQQKTDNRFLGKPKAAFNEIDFDKNLIVAIYMGQKPSAGYQLNLEHNYIDINNGTAELRLKSTQPGSDQVSAQILTSPCLLVQLPKADYKTLTVLDDSGKIKQQLDLPK